MVPPFRAIALIVPLCWLTIHWTIDRSSPIPPVKDYQTVYISSPDIADSDYTLYSNGSASGEAADGLYTGGSHQNETKVVEFTISETVIWLNESGVTTGSGGFGGGGMGCQKPDRGDSRNIEGVTPPEMDIRGGGMFEGLDEETQAALQEIIEQQQNGTITRE